MEFKLAPIKALCNERYQDWTRKFNPLGVKVVEITGDQEGQDVEKIKSHNMIITTPEKWDAVSRWMSITEPKVMNSEWLLLIDEVHLTIRRGVTCWRQLCADLRLLRVLQGMLLSLQLSQMLGILLFGLEASSAISLSLGRKSGQLS